MLVTLYIYLSLFETLATACTSYWLWVPLMELYMNLADEVYQTTSYIMIRKYHPQKKPSPVEIL